MSADGQLAADLTDLLAFLATDPDGVTVEVAAPGTLADAQAAYDTVADNGLINVIRLLPGVHTWSGPLRGVGAIAGAGGTIIQIDGATINNTGTAVNMLINSYVGESFGGYTGRSNIAVIGDGVINHNAYDGTTGTQVGLNDVIAFGHGRCGYVGQGVTILDVSAGHGVEFNAWDQGLTEDVSYTGFLNPTGVDGRDFSEAVQLDAATDTGGVVAPDDGTCCRNIAVRGCTFDRSVRGGYYGSMVGSHSAPSPGVHANIDVVDNTSYGTVASGVHAFGWANFNIDRNQINGAQPGVKVEHGPTAGNVGNGSITGNTFTDPQSMHVQVVTDTDGYLIGGLTVADNTGTGAGSDGDSNGLQLNGVLGLAVTGNTIDGASLRALSVTNSPNAMIADNEFTDSVIGAIVLHAGSVGSQILRNLCTSVVDDAEGIRIDSTVADVVVGGNITDGPNIYAADTIVNRANLYGLPGVRDKAEYPGGNRTLNVWLRDPAGQIIGKLDWRSVDSERIWNVAGTITVTARLDDMTLLAMQPGYGCAVDFPARRWFHAGDFYTHTGQRSASGDSTAGIGQATLTALDDLSIAADEEIWVDPTVKRIGLLTQMTPAYDVQSGPAESVIKSYITRNVGVGRHPNRAGGVTTPMKLLHVLPDQYSGPPVTAQAREDLLLDFTRAIATPAGMRMWTSMDRVTGAITFDCEPVVDHRGVNDQGDYNDPIAFSMENGTLSDVTWTVTKPVTNRATILGPGELAQRWMTTAQDTDSIKEWGRVVATPSDRTDLGGDYATSLTTIATAQTALGTAQTAYRTAIVAYQAAQAAVSNAQLALDNADSGAQKTRAQKALTKALAALTARGKERDTANVTLGKAQATYNTAVTTSKVQLGKFQAAMLAAAKDAVAAAPITGVRSATLVDSPNIRLGVDVEIGDAVFIQPFPGVTYGNHIESAKLHAEAGQGVTITMSTTDSAQGNALTRATRALETRIRRLESR